MTAKSRNRLQEPSRAETQRLKVDLFDPFERIFRPRSWIDSFAGFAEVADLGTFRDDGRDPGSKTG